MPQPSFSPNLQQSMCGFSGFMGVAFLGSRCISLPCPCRVSLNIEEKVTLTALRDGGLQNLEVHGLVTLRITDEQFGRIKLIFENHDDKGVQVQVMVESVDAYNEYNRI